jgi:hypothetical protein
MVKIRGKWCRKAKVEKGNWEADKGHGEKAFGKKQFTSRDKIKDIFSRRFTEVKGRKRGNY